MRGPPSLARLTAARAPASERTICLSGAACANAPALGTATKPGEVRADARTPVERIAFSHPPHVLYDGCDVVETVEPKLDESAECCNTRGRGSSSPAWPRGGHDSQRRHQKSLTVFLLSAICAWDKPDASMRASTAFLSLAVNAGYFPLGSSLWNARLLQ